MPSHFARSSPELEQLADELGVARRDSEDPLQMLLWLNEQLYDKFSYVKQSTSVDSPIEEALVSRKGVCQDFAHIMTALLRNLRIPCRYVSGYLNHDEQHTDRSADGATHAWVEAFLPRLGWVGFDPTNRLIAGERHIRTAIGRDYADVPPTQGTMKGRAQTEFTSPCPRDSFGSCSTRRPGVRRRPGMVPIPRQRSGSRTAPRPTTTAVNPIFI